MDTNNENSGIVEPYELDVESVDVDTPPQREANQEEEQRPISSPSEVDLSGYQYDIVPTYKMIEDPDDQDTLFRIQFLQAFGITTDEYHPEIVSAVINDLYERYKDHVGIREILELHPLYHSGIVVSSDTEDANKDVINGVDSGDNVEIEVDTETPPLSPSPRARRCLPKGDNSEMIFCMMFSFHLFDLFHKCIRHAKYKEEIPTTLRDEILENVRSSF
jgi:hypothetical protein